jgi:DNA ligase 1
MKIIHQSPRIYIRQDNDTIRYWIIKVISEGDMFSEAVVTREFGTLGRKSISNKYLVSVGKNLGRKNQTSPAEQAINEAKRQYLDKLNEGYREVIETDNDKLTINDKIQLLIRLLPKTKIDINDTPKPMKAVPFKADSFAYPAIVQPKINGVRSSIRLEVTKYGMFEEEPAYIIRSMEGHEYKVSHISEYIKELIDSNTSELIFEGYPKLEFKDLVFDGELYIPYEKSPTIKGAASNRNNPLHHKVFFILFDLAMPDIDQVHRLKILSSIFKSTPNDKINDLVQPNFVYLTSEVVNNDTEAKEKAGEYLSLGFEGAILRDPFTKYQFGKRRKNMMKIKKQQKGLFTIVDIIPQDKMPDLGLAVCLNNTTDEMFQCSINGSFEFRRNCLELKHSYIGKKAIVGYFERTKTGLPFHARVLEMP